MTTVAAAIVLVLVGSDSVLRATQTPAEARPLDVGNLTLIGVAAIDEGRLRGVPHTRERSWLPGKEDRPFNQQELQADLLRTVAYYRDHGFPNARVASSDVDVTADQREVSITSQIAEGSPLRLAGVRLAGFLASEISDALSSTLGCASRARWPTLSSRCGRCCAASKVPASMRLRPSSTAVPRMRTRQRRQQRARPGGHGCGG